MRRFIKTLTITTIAVGLVACSVLAANNTAEVKKIEGENRPERPAKPENEVFGKITSIDANTITVTIAEMKIPEGRTNPPENNNKNDNDINKNNNSREDRPEINMDDMFTLTNNTKTYTITNANLIKFKKPDFDKNDNTNKSTNKDDMKNKTREELEKENKATYTDFAVGDYVSIELESSTSTNAKTVRSFDRFGGGRGMDGGRGFDKDKK